MIFENLPDKPGALLQHWLDHARDQSGQTNWNVMMLATVGAGQPSVRPVLLKEFDPAACTFTFFTNYDSHKSRDIEANPNVGVSMYWDALERQIRFEGVTKRASAAVSDAYFATRPRGSQIGAWASQQSQPIEGYDALVAKAEAIEKKYDGQTIPRPPHWGGYIIAAKRIEFWHGRPGRIHERIAYSRADIDAHTWQLQWLNP